MLVCNVSLRPPRLGIAVDIAETVEAVDATATGQVVFATLVDDPASVLDIVNAYLGEIMLEATTASETVDAVLVAVYDVSIAEVAAATDTIDAPTAWTPASVATLGWYDASSASNLVISGSNTVDQWSDLSGKGNHVLGPTGGAAGTKPTYTTSGANQINGLNTVLFNGSDNLLVCYGLAGFPADNTTTISCVCVFRARSLTDRGHLDFTDSSVLTNRTAMLFSETGNTSARSGGTGNTVSKAFSDTVNPHLWSTVHGASDRQIRQDGGTATTNSSTNATYAHTNFRIGRLFQDVYPMLGDFAELIVFQGTNSTTREKCEGYLAHKWGLASALPSGHPYKSSPPTV